MVNGITLFTRGHKWIIYCGETPKSFRTGPRLPRGASDLFGCGGGFYDLFEARRPEPLEEGVDWAVVGWIVADFLDGFLEHGSESHHLGEPDIFAEMFVLSNDDMSEVKRELELIFGDDDGRVGPERVPHTEFVEGVAVGS